MVNGLVLSYSVHTQKVIPGHPPKKLLAENLHTGILQHDVQCDFNRKKEEETG